MRLRTGPRPGPVVFDGLWQCLCPALRPSTLPWSLGASRSGSSLQAPVKRGKAADRLQKRRCFSTEAAVPVSSAITCHESSATYPPSASSATLTAGDLLKTHLPSSSELERVPLATIESAIRAIRFQHAATQVPASLNRSRRILRLVTHCLTERSCPPTPFIYESLAEALAAPQGSAKALSRLLKDMQRQGVKPTAEFCEAAMAALVNHPDYAFREDVLNVMKEFWYDLEGPGKARQFYLLGLLRDEQYEVAYGKLEEMMTDASKSPMARLDGWALDVFMMVFGKLRFLDEVVKMYEFRERLAKEEREQMRKRKAGRAEQEVKRKAWERTRVNLLFCMLDTGSAVYHHGSTVFAWERLFPTTGTHLTMPPDGVLENVLGTAARHGDTHLASHTLEMLSSRSRVRSWHYESVVEAFVRAQDWPGVIRMFSIMHREGFAVTREETQLFCNALKSKGEPSRAAEQAVREHLGAEVRADAVVPYPVIAAVIEATAEVWGSAEAMSLYRETKMAWDKAGLASRLLLTMVICSHEETTTQELVKEYSGVVPDATQVVVDHGLSDGQCGKLIQAFARNGLLGHAYAHASAFVAAADGGASDNAAATTSGTWGFRHGGLGDSEESRAWLETLVQASVEAQDGRVYEFLDRLESHGQQCATAAGVVRAALGRSRG